jgi:hypothetical protein
MVARLILYIYLVMLGVNLLIEQPLGLAIGP